MCRCGITTFELITGFHAIIKWTLQLHYAKSHISISNAKMNTSLVPIGKLKLTMKLTTQQIQLDPIRKLSVIKWCGFQINMQFICCLCSFFHAGFTIYVFISIHLVRYKHPLVCLRYYFYDLMMIKNFFLFLVFFSFFLKRKCIYNTNDDLWCKT